MTGSSSSKESARKAKKKYSRGDDKEPVSQPISITKQLEALKEGREKGLGNDWQVVYNRARDIVIWICPNTGKDYDRLSKALHAAEEWKQEVARQLKAKQKRGDSASPQGRKQSPSNPSRTNQNRKTTGKTTASLQSIQAYYRPKPKSPKDEKRTSPKTNKVARNSTTPENSIILSSDTDDSQAPIRTTKKRKPKRVTNRKATPPKSMASHYAGQADDSSSSSSEIYKWDDDFLSNSQKKKNSKIRSPAASKKLSKRNLDNAFPQKEIQIKQKKSKTTTHGGESRIALADSKAKDFDSPSKKASPKKKKGRPTKITLGTPSDKQKGSHTKAASASPAEPPKKGPSRPKKNSPDTKNSQDNRRETGPLNGSLAKESKKDAKMCPGLPLVDVGTTNDKNGKDGLKDLSPTKRGRGRPRKYPFISDHNNESVNGSGFSSRGAAPKPGQDEPRNTAVISAKKNEIIDASDADITHAAKKGHNGPKQQHDVTSTGTRNDKNGEGANGVVSPTKKIERGPQSKSPSINVNDKLRESDRMEKEINTSLKHRAESVSKDPTQSALAKKLDEVRKQKEKLIVDNGMRLTNNDSVALVNHAPKLGHDRPHSTNNGSVEALHSGIPPTSERGGDRLQRQDSTSNDKNDGVANKELNPTIPPMVTRTASKGDSNPPTTSNNAVSINGQASVPENKMGQPSTPLQIAVINATDSMTTLNAAPKPGHDIGSVEGKAKSTLVNRRQTQLTVSDVSPEPKATAKGTNMVPACSQMRSIDTHGGQQGEGVSKELSSSPPVALKRALERPPKNLVTASGRPKRPLGLTRKAPAKKGRGRRKKRKMAISNNSTYHNIIDALSHIRRSRLGGAESGDDVKRKSQTSNDQERGYGTNTSPADVRVRSQPVEDDSDDCDEIRASSYVYPPWLPQPDPRAKIAFLRAHKKDKSDPIVHLPIVDNYETSEDEKPRKHKAFEHDHFEDGYFAASNKIASHTLFATSAPSIKCKQPCPEWFSKTIAIDAKSMEALIRGCINTSQIKNSNRDSITNEDLKNSIDCKPSTDSQGNPKVPTIYQDIGISPSDHPSDDSKQRRVTRGMVAKSEATKEALEYIWDKHVQQIIKSVETSNDGYWV